MFSLSNLRKAFRKAVSRAISDQAQPVVWRSDARDALSTHEKMLRPTIYSQPIQVLDPVDPNFGKFYFLPDYDPPGNPDGLPLR